MPPSLPWIIALGAGLLLLALLGAWALRSRPRKLPPLPTDWALSGRPVFSTDERKVYRHLREALPHHIVLAKLPLIRFSQPNDPQQVRYWYELLGALHVTFAVCSANGRVLVAFDLDTERSAGSRRTQAIKENVLAACKVRYLRIPVDHLPSVPELQLLLPQAQAPARAPNPAPGLGLAPSPLPGLAGSRRRERRALWQDSGFFQDSFFGADRQGDAGPASEFGTLGSILREGVTVREVGLSPAEGGTPPGKGNEPPPTRH